MRNIGNKPVYPSTEQHTVVDGVCVQEPMEYGMSYREYLIAQIAGHFIASPKLKTVDGLTIAEDCIKIADAIIEKLNHEK